GTRLHALRADVPTHLHDTNGHRSSATVVIESDLALAGVVGSGEEADDSSVDLLAIDFLLNVGSSFFGVCLDDDVLAVRHLGLSLLVVNTVEGRSPTGNRPSVYWFGTSDLLLTLSRA